MCQFCHLDYLQHNVPYVRARVCAVCARVRARARALVRGRVCVSGHVFMYKQKLLLPVLHIEIRKRVVCI